jgi:hypothetical protein
MADDLDTDDRAIPSWVVQYPQPDITPAEFESFVAAMFRSAEPGIDSFRVASHEVISGTDGTFDFDATVRYRLLGMEFLVVVEAKRHSNPIKRELLQVLHSKALSVGAHKAVLVSTARFQRGAIEFATTHGIALVAVAEGRFTFETRGATPIPTLSPEQAAAYGVPTFVGVYYGASDTPDSWVRAVVGPHDPQRVRELLLAMPDDSVDVGL